MKEPHGEVVDLLKISAQIKRQSGLNGKVGSKTINIGEDGATFIPSVSEDGILSWSNDKDLPNPEPVNIKGEDGEDGFSPVVAVEDIDGGHRVTITDKDGDKAFDVMDGKDGQGGSGGGGVTSWNDLTDKPDFAPIATSGSWNDLTDKPFGSEVTEGVITFDGDLNSKEHYTLGGNVILVKMTEQLLTVDELVGSTVVFGNEFMGIKEFEVTSEDVQSEPVSATGTFTAVMKDGDMTVAVLDEAAMGLPKGTYFIYHGAEEFCNYYIKSISCLTGSVETVKPLDEKYIPDSVVLESELENIKAEMVSAVIAALPVYNGEVVPV